MELAKDSAGSVTELANRLDRDYKSVHDDIEQLHDLLSFDQQGGATSPKQVSFDYDEIIFDFKPRAEA